MCKCRLVAGSCVQTKRVNMRGNGIALRIAPDTLPFQSKFSKNEYAKLFIFTCSP